MKKIFILFAMFSFVSITLGQSINFSELYAYRFDFNKSDFKNLLNKKNFIATGENQYRKYNSSSKIKDVELISYNCCYNSKAVISYVTFISDNEECFRFAEQIISSILYNGFTFMGSTTENEIYKESYYDYNRNWRVGLQYIYFDNYLLQGPVNFIQIIISPGELG